MATHIQTNEQAFRKLFKNLSTLEIALLRERIVLIMTETKKAITKDPKPFYNPIFPPSMYISLADKVEQYIPLG